MSLSRAEQLVIDYAVNRQQIGDINKAIKLLNRYDGNDFGIPRLDEVRQAYLSVGYYWSGWRVAIDHYIDSGEDQPLSVDQYLLADLLDAKSALRIEAGQIKRSMTAVGRKLARVNHAAEQEGPPAVQ